MKKRKALFAGSWYPGTASACEAEIQRLIAGQHPVSVGGAPPVGGIVPHAGWTFSGKIAGSVIQQLAQGSHPDILLLFGMHLHAESANYIMRDGAWETPLGEIAIATEIADPVSKKFPFRIETPDRYTEDNTIELQLPFIKYFYPEVRIVPIGVPPVAASFEIGRFAIEQARLNGLAVQVIGSTDLTHYGFHYGFTPKGSGQEAYEWVRKENDRSMIDRMLRMDAEAILADAEQKHNACCAGAAATAVAAGRALGAQSAREIAYATSYEISPGSSFVGYVGVVF